MAARWARRHEEHVESFEARGGGSGSADVRASLLRRCSLASMLVVLCFGFASDAALPASANTERADDADDASGDSPASAVANASRAVTRAVAHAAAAMTTSRNVAVSAEPDAAIARERCVPAPQLTTADATLLLSHLVRARFYRIYAPTEDSVFGDDPAQAMGDELWVRCEWVAARAHSAATAAIDATPNCRAMSDVARALFRTLPEGLVWEQCEGSLGCYVAEHAMATGGTAWFSVNVVTGAALRNGAAPSRLPAAMLSHETYVNAFDDAQFEVTDDYQTRQAIQGRSYKFARAESRLLVHEVDGTGDAQEVLELLTGTLRQLA